MSDMDKNTVLTEETRDDVCPKAAGGHEPDMHSAHITSDGGEQYVDVNCKHCGRSGCLGTLSDLVANVQW